MSQTSHGSHTSLFAPRSVSDMPLATARGTLPDESIAISLAGFGEVGS